MFQGLDHVGKAVRILASRNAMLNQRLYEAAREFSAALLRPEEWPEDLLDKAQDIHRKLTARGRIDQTIVGMDVSAAAEVAEEILDLSVAISAASIHEMKRQISQMPTRRPARNRRLDVTRSIS